ncbi:MAG: 2TM domain-containing protein [Chitinophagaceae bacterium]|nr:2TM domain-containing protein [Chitinophagaceae bacterium]
MNSYNTTPEGKDPQLWDIARRRASFKSHLATYIVINVFFWVLWYFTKEQHRPYEFNGMRIPWPVWPMLGWGIGLVFHYIGAYVSPKSNSVDKEYEKLIQKQNKQY